MRLSSLDLLHSNFRQRLEALLQDLAAQKSLLKPFETIRSPARQDELFSRGRDPKAADFGRTVTKARAYQSAHQFGLAADLVFHVKGK